MAGPMSPTGASIRVRQIGAGLTEKDGIEQPVHYWDPSIAPSGMAFYTGDRYPEWKGNLFVGALVQKHLARLVLDGEGGGGRAPL